MMASTIRLRDARRIAHRTMLQEGFVGREDQGPTERYLSTGMVGWAAQYNHERCVWKDPEPP